MFTSEMFGSCVCPGGEKLPCNCLVRSHAEDMIPWTLITRTLNFYPVFLRQLIGFNASIVNFQNWTKCCAAAMLLSEKNEFVHICHLEKSVCLLLAKFPPEAGVAQSESRQSLRTGKILSVDRWTSQVDRWTLHMVLELGCSDSTQDGDEWKCLVFGFLAVLVKYFINCFILWQITNLYLFVFLLVWIGSAAPISFNRLHPRSDQLAPLLSRPER